MGNWQKIYNSDIEHRAKIVRDVLKESGLSPVILNKQDRSYKNFGSYEVVVKPDEVIRALKIINDEICFE